mmetsp:Transcript_22478/g.77020  ORF Transcript_22478/g.77020 Transcript_22478/m.77020 type:complete len:850 (+) Transcript_22478:28-2577(+)
MLPFSSGVRSCLIKLPSLIREHRVLRSLSPHHTAFRNLAEMASSTNFWHQARLAAASAAGVAGHIGVSAAGVAAGAAEAAAGAAAGAASVVQDTTTRTCCVCSQSVLRPAALECKHCHQAHCRNCRVVITGPTDGSFASAEESLRSQLSACKNCEELVREQVRGLNVQERMQRIDAFLQGRLPPFVYTPEGKLDKAMRLGSYGLSGLKQVVGFLPIGQIATVVKAGYYLVRYGPIILSGNDIMEVFQLLVNLASMIDCERSRLASPDFFGGLYYMMGEHWGERSKMPVLEFQEHVDAQGSIPRPPEALLRQLHFLVRLLSVSKEPTAPDMQRILRQAVPGAQVVLAETASGTIERAHSLVCDRHSMLAYLILPGTSSVSDFVTDFNAEGEEVEDGLAHRGMLKSAQWLQKEIGPILLHLHQRGYQVTVVGHSLGAGVGAFFSLLMRPQISSIQCFGLGTPACIDERLIPAFLDIMVSVVNRDDMVPRLTVRSVEHLVHTVLCPGQVAKTKAWMAEDLQAIKDVERVVELRRRQTGARQQTQGTQSDESKVELLVEAGVSRDVAERALREENGDVALAMLKATEEEANPTVSPFAAAMASASASAPSPLAFDGALANEPASPSKPSAPPAPCASPAAAAATAADPGTVLMGGLRRLSTDATRAFESTGGYVQSALGRLSIGGSPGGADAPPRPSKPRPCQLYIPGQVVHLFRQDGIARAAMAPAMHEAFSRITIGQDMMNDHKLTAYSEALRQALISSPQTSTWEPFQARKVCACCEAEFNWAFVLQSEPQRMLARHHCFACGRGVCDGCSRKRLAHPELGFCHPVRTCDACYFKCFDQVPGASASSAMN